MNKIHLLIILFLICHWPKCSSAVLQRELQTRKLSQRWLLPTIQRRATEAYYNEQVQNILKHYNAAEVATAGIFASKFLDRKALTELGVWSSSTENYYYRRIYNMVSRKIMPKIWTVAGMMLKSPQNSPVLGQLSGEDM